MSPESGRNLPPWLLQVWAASRSLLTVPGPSSLSLSTVGTSVPNPESSAPHTTLPLLGHGSFHHRKSLQVCPLPRARGFGESDPGEPFGPTAAAAPQTPPGGPGSRPRPSQRLTQPWVQERDRAERPILVLGDSDSSRRDSPGRGLV